jgi:hypothetical protein
VQRSAPAYIIPHIVLDVAYLSSISSSHVRHALSTCRCRSAQITDRSSGNELQVQTKTTHTGSPSSTPSKQNIPDRSARFSPSYLLLPHLSSFIYLLHPNNRANYIFLLCPHRPPPILSPSSTGMGRRASTAARKTSSWGGSAVGDAGVASPARATPPCRRRPSLSLSSSPAVDSALGGAGPMPRWPLQGAPGFLRIQRNLESTAKSRER